MTTKRDFDLHLAIYAEDGEYCGGVMGRVVTSDILRHGERNLAYYAFRKAEDMIAKWLDDPRWSDCELSSLKVKLYLGDRRFDLVFNATEWTRILHTRNTRIKTAWKLFEPVTYEPSEIPDNDIPF